MTAAEARAWNAVKDQDVAQVTLLELVQAVCDVTGDDREVVETVRHLLHSGRVQLCGNFRGCGPRAFRD